MAVTLSFQYIVYFYKLDRSFYNNMNVDCNINISCLIVTFDNINLSLSLYYQYILFTLFILFNDRSIKLPDYIFKIKYRIIFKYISCKHFI